MKSIPVVDISAAVTGGDDGAVVDALRQAMSEVGFLQVVGHGVPLELIGAAHHTMVEMDEYPEDVRAALVRPRGLSRGIFERFGAEGFMSQRGFQFVPYDTVEEAELAGATRYHPDYFDANVWPDDERFRGIWKEYSDRTRALAHILMSAFAKAFGLPGEFFAEPFAHDVTLFSANWYPRQEDVGEDARILLRGHPDSGVLTILHQQGDYEGLQVLRDGEWVTVPMLPDAFVINIGELMSRWTNGRWTATVHRVVASTVPVHSRSSIAVFFLPSIDEVIAPLPGTVGEEGPLYEPISTYDWQHKFMTEYVLATGG